MPQLTLLKNARLYAPDFKGTCHICMAGGKIVSVTDRDVSLPDVLDAEVVDLAGKIVTPGFIDNHVHTLGGGGGLGFASRAIEIQVSQIVRAGVTTIVGMLGFDATTKSIDTLVAKTKGLRQEGVNAYCLTGATLEHPIPTLTGKIRTDIVFVEEIIGVGEISISELGYAYDSMGSGAQYIAEAATAGLLAGRLSGKAGYLCLQVPPYRERVLKPMFEVVERTGIPIGQFVPSHVNQTPTYMNDATEWGKMGGWVDIGVNYSPTNNYSRAIEPLDAVAQFLDAGVPLEKILMSSDGNGAPPKEEKGEGRPKRTNYMPISSMLSSFRQLVETKTLAPTDALKPFTSNPAQATGLSSKGVVETGRDADLLVFDDDWNLDSVYIMGHMMMGGGSVKKRGVFEELLLQQLR